VPENGSADIIASVRSPEHRRDHENMTRVCRFEVPVDDTERAAAFFKHVFGWQLTKQRESGHVYFKIRTHRGKEAGIDGRFYDRHQVPPKNARLINMIRVDDVDLYVRKIEAAGGKKVFGKIRAPGMGNLAYFRDPDGNLMGIIQEER
jgi:predicted enzyme related to lactoylglutathione lyase